MITTSPLTRLFRFLLLVLSFGSAGMAFAQNIGDCPGTHTYTANFAALSVQFGGTSGGDYGNIVNYSGVLPGDPADIPFGDSVGQTSAGQVGINGDLPMGYVMVDDPEDPTTYQALPTAPSASHAIRLVISPTDFAVNNGFTYDLNSLSVSGTGSSYEVYFNGTLVSGGFSELGLAAAGADWNQGHLIEIRPYSTTGEQSFTLTGVDADVTLYGPDGTYHACTGAKLTPEPSAALLSLLAGLGFLARRRR